MIQHTCYHLISEHKDQFLTNLNDVRSTVDSWKSEGEINIKIFKLMTEELGSDAINLEEKRLSEEEIY